MGWKKEMPEGKVEKRMNDKTQIQALGEQWDTDRFLDMQRALPGIGGIRNVDLLSDEVIPIAGLQTITPEQARGKLTGVFPIADVIYDEDDIPR